MSFGTDRDFLVTFRPHVLTIALLTGAAMAAASCSGSSTKPSPVVTLPPDPTPPVPKPNDAPIITSLTTSSPRAEEDNVVTVTAVVEDVETPADQLTYAWSATPVNGTFTGTGRQVQWRAPRLQPTPDTYTLTVLVTERFTVNGEARENKVTRSVQIHYNDSYRDVTKISMRYLTELFPNFSVTPQQAVQDFSDSCPGKAQELIDVQTNRANFKILSGTYTNVVVTMNSTLTSADVRGTCTFVDIPTDPKNPNFGKQETVSGTCTLTAIYENWRWFLCDSRFAGSIMTSSLYGRVPGRIISE
jgi:hypothetical protein